MFHTWSRGSLQQNLHLQVIAGNHEQSQDFLHYKARFEMPMNSFGYDKNQFYRFFSYSFYSILLASTWDLSTL